MGVPGASWRDGRMVVSGPSSGAATAGGAGVGARHGRLAHRRAGPVGRGGTGGPGAVRASMAGAGPGTGGPRPRAASPGPSGSGSTGSGLPGSAENGARPRRHARNRRKDSGEPADVDMLLSP